MHIKSNHTVMNFRTDSQQRALAVSIELRKHNIPVTVTREGGQSVITTDTRAFDIAPTLNKILYAPEVDAELPVPPELSALETLAEKARKYDETINRLERVPTGDDYNELFSEIMHALVQAKVKL